MLHRQDHPTDKYSSMAFSTRNTVEVIELEYISSVNGLKLAFVHQQYCWFTENRTPISHTT